jgi:hypothetical protein
MDAGAASDAKLTELRAMYEPFVNGLSHFLMFNLPPVFVEKPTVDNWQTSAWTQRTPGIGNLSVRNMEEEHFS